MTDRIKGCWVAFDGDIREDDVESIVNAIMMIKRVSAVTTSKCNSDDWMNRERVKREVSDKLYEAINLVFGPQAEGMLR